MRRRLDAVYGHWCSSKWFVDTAVRMAQCCGLCIFSADTTVRSAVLCDIGPGGQEGAAVIVGVVCRVRGWGIHRKCPPWFIVILLFGGVAPWINRGAPNLRRRERQLVMGHL